MRGHSFYLILVIVITLSTHKMMYALCDLNNVAVPTILLVPKLEIMVFFVLLMVIVYLLLFYGSQQLGFRLKNDFCDVFTLSFCVQLVGYA